METIPKTDQHIKICGHNPSTACPAPQVGVHRPPSTGHRAPLFLLLLLLAACQSGPDQNRVAVETFVEQEVENRLALYRRILNQQCRDNILEEAGRIADSILITEARLRRDSLGKPPKPEKPERPELKQLKDSLRLDPLFRDTSGQGGN